MRHLFVMDPLARLQLSGDSTYVTMRECTDRKHVVYWCEPSALFALDGRARAVATEVRTLAAEPWFVEGQLREVDLGEFDLVWMRKDPPFHMGYIFATYLLDMVPASTLVVNGPSGLKLFNEKMWAARFPELHPSTLISNDVRRLRATIDAYPGRAVLKPWDGNGGRGVLVTSGSDRNLGSILDLLTSEGQEHVLCQPFLEGVEQGDKRILIYDGEPVGQMLRVPSAKDFRGNMHVGASVQACELDDRDLHICRTLAPELKRWQQVFVGIDVIDGYLTEINVTSPTGIREINALFDTRLEAQLVDSAISVLERHRENA